MTGEAESLRTHGLRATEQRVRLLRALKKRKAPATVERIAGSVGKTVDLATAYRALQEFERVGLAHRVVRPGGSSLYEAAGLHHHHLTCRSCGAVEDVDVCLPDALPAKILGQSKRFAEIEDHALEFFGTCTTCAT